MLAGDSLDRQHKSETFISFADVTLVKFKCPFSHLAVKDPGTSTTTINYCGTSLSKTLPP
jgi:hypothetical protein